MSSENLLLERDGAVAVLPINRAQAREHALRGQRVFDLVASAGKPFVAAVNGDALGGGCELLEKRKAHFTGR